MRDYSIEFLTDPRYGGDGRYREAFRVTSWDEARSFVGWERERDHTREIRITHDGQVLGDPGAIKRLTDMGLDKNGYRPEIFPTVRGGESEWRARCAGSVCRICHNVGAEYRGFYRLGSHRRFAVCPVCGDATELQPGSECSPR